MIRDHELKKDILGKEVKKMHGRKLTVAFFLIAFFMLGLKVGFGADNKELVSKGEKLYAEKKCAVCHMINGKGGKLGGELGGVGSDLHHHNAAYLRNSLKILRQ